MATICTVERSWASIRRPRPQDEPSEVDCYSRGLDLRFALATARPGGSLCVRGREGEVCERLRIRVEQSNERRSVRSSSLRSAGRITGCHIKFCGSCEI